MGAGAHEAWWNGTSDSGIAQPSGVYFVRLRAGATVQSRKLVLLK
jgi:hypothetical protein